MGGSIGLGNITPAAEFNIFCDPEAAHIVLNSGLDHVVMVPLDVTETALASTPIIERIKNTLPNPHFVELVTAHRSLPRKIRFVGDQYVKSEFRSHRTVSDKKFLEPFFAQWTSYLTLIREQAALKDGSSEPKEFGRHLDPQMLEKLDDDKAEQLLELHRATQGQDEPQASAAPPKRK
ncbi:hypothetical protein EV183_003216 [Coemansia sp. RSA 2336]|nr:hypothetical protein EV183_003216 [Coemansia sp. RSA 2336]